MNRYQRLILASAVCLGCFAAATAADPPQPVPAASEQVLRQLERDGAYRCKLMIVDANGERVAALDGVVGKTAMLQASPGDGRNGFETSLKVDPQSDGHLAVTLDLGERTNVTASASGSTTWKSTNLLLVKKVKLDSQYEVRLPGWETSRPGPLKLTLSIQRFKADF